MNAKMSDHWNKLQELIQAARDNDELGKKLRTGSPTDVTAALQEYGLTMDDMGAIFTDLEVIADRNSLRWWSPLA
jgi:hypothetical protein